MIPGLNILKKIFKTSNERKLTEIQPLVQKINLLELEIQKLSDQELKNKTQEFKNRIKKGENLIKILPEAFACVREASIRTTGQRHFDVQLMGGIILHQGSISEMKTGEGKTLVATLPAYLNSLTEKGVHVVTVNDYLAKRDSEWMSKIYNFLGVSVGCVTSGIEDISRKAQYECDITYGTNNEFGFDYLRDNMKYSIAEMVQRKHYFCIVDEVDSILIDEARTPLIISGPTEDNSSQYFLCNKLVNQLSKEHYDTDEKDRSALLTEKGIDFIEDKLRKINLLKGSNFYDPQNLSIVHHINQSLRANMLFSKDKDYIVKDNQIYIIDEFTGRIMEGRRYSDGLHQAIEAKEGVQIQNENQTLASITFQNYFRLYEKLSGMTGTAMTEAEEFYEIYKLDVVEVPTNRPMVRKDLNDKIFRTEKEKYNAIIKEIISANEKRQPVLIGTTSIEKSVRPTKQLPTIIRSARAVGRIHHIVAIRGCRAPLLNHLLIHRLVRAGRVHRIPPFIRHHDKHSYVRTVVLGLNPTPRLFLLWIGNRILHLLLILRLPTFRSPRFYGTGIRQRVFLGGHRLHRPARRRIVRLGHRPPRKKEGEEQES